MPPVVRSRGRLPRHPGFLATIAVVVTLGLIAGCAPAPAGDRAAIDGLLVLTATPDGQTSLGAWSFDAAADDGAGDVVRSPLQTTVGAMAWIASGRGRVLAATGIDGSLHTSDPVGLGEDLAWRPVEARGLDGDAPPAPAWFVTWDPEGGRFATITGDLPGGDDVDVTLIDPSTRSAFVIPLGRALLPSAPAWLDGDRVALVGGSTTDPVAVIVDTGTSEVGDGPAGDRRLASSADGSIIASAGGPGSPVLIRASAAWIAGDGTSIGSVEAPNDGALATSIALDSTGRRLAIAWQGVDGGLRIDIHDGVDGWRRVASPPLAAGANAVVAWSR